MPISLHTAVIGTYLQILPQVGGFVDKAEEHCRANDLSAEALTGASLADDMWNFAKQVSQACHHSARAVLAVRAGLGSPDIAPVPLDFASIRKEVADSLTLLQAVEPAELEAIEGRETVFTVGTFKMTFTVSDFLLTFSLPNFYFHATTAYDVLRSKGVPLGKSDYLGRIRLKH